MSREACTGAPGGVERRPRQKLALKPRVDQCKATLGVRGSVIVPDTTRNIRAARLPHTPQPEKARSIV